MSHTFSNLQPLTKSGIPFIYALTLGTEIPVSPELHVFLTAIDGSPFL